MAGFGIAAVALLAGVFELVVHAVPQPVVEAAVEAAQGAAPRWLSTRGR